MNMRIFNLITAGLAMLFISSGVTANADDLMVCHKTKDGKNERLVVDHSRLPELRKAIYESKSIDRFKASSENHMASLIKIHDTAGSPEPEEPEGFAVRFAVEDEEPPTGWIYQPFKAYVCKGDGAFGQEYYNYSYYPDEYIIEQGYTWGCYVPEGEYTVILTSDIYTDMGNGEMEFLTYLYVVKENVKIEGDTLITFNQNEAKNCITSSCFFPNGTETPKDCFKYDESGECLGMRDDFCSASTRSILHINGDYALNLVNFRGTTDFVYVNDLSENWIYVIDMTMVDKNGAYANCVSYPGPITSSMNICNDPTGYELTKVKFNSELPNVYPATKGFGINTDVTWKGVYWLGSRGIIYEGLGISDELPLYINTKASDLTSSDAFDLITTPIVATDKILIMAEDWEGNPILDENGEQMFYYDYPTVAGPQIYHDQNDKYMGIISLNSFRLPYDYRFSFEITPTTEFFSQAPVLAVSPESFIREGYSRFYISTSFNYPCLSSYSLPYSFNAKYNGISFAEGYVNTSYLTEWSYENYKEPGVFDIEFHSTWQIEAPNAIIGNKLHIDTRCEDYYAPQLLLWQLRDENNILNKVATIGSKLCLVCQENYDSNFNLSISSPEVDNYDFKIEKLYDEWTNQAVRRVYEVSLEDFPGEVGKKYSLEFNLSDASGNTSTQAIGNAFEWAGTTSVNSITADSNVYVADGILHAPDNAEVFTIDGRHVDRNTLASGLYIVRTGNNTNKVLVP